MLERQELDWLLEDLCVKEGICLPSSTRAILHDPHGSPSDFARAVLRAEGLDPDTHRELYDRVLARSFRAFDRAAERTAAARTASQVQSLVAAQVALVEDLARRKALATILVEPRPEDRDWDYGKPGDRYRCWVVAQDRGMVLVYCDQGFGPEFPWGAIPEEADESLGMDAQWCWYLEEAFVRSGLWQGAMKPGLEEAFHASPAERLRSQSRDT
ncbi:MAG: hypothetical protein ABJE47_25350 [bacterium]